MARKNPVVGQHPDLFKKDQWGMDPESTDIIVDFKDMSPKDLLNAAEKGELGEDVYQGIADFENMADGDPSVLEAEGINPELAQAIVAGIYEEMQEVDEEGRERRIKPFVDYIRVAAEAQIEYEKSDDNLENYANLLQESLASISTSKLVRAATEVSELAEEVDEDTLATVLQDPALYRVEVSSGYGRAEGVVWGAEAGDLEGQMDGWKYDETLARYLNGGWKGDTYFPELSESDIAAAVKELERGEPSVYLSGHRRGKSYTADDFYSSFTFTTSADFDRIVAVIDGEALDAALAEHVDQGEAPPPGKDTDTVVHEYAGTNDSVAGASGRGMYVAQLTPKELRKEGATLGHCIGTEQYGHPRMLREGRTRVYSIRTEAGKPKFTIEVDARSNKIMEIKGKANRLPGFEPNKDGMSKPDDVRLVTDFLLSQGYTADDIRQTRDIRAGVLAMEEAGVDPFSPPQVKKRERKNPAEPKVFPLSPRVAKLAEKDYNRPFGGHWGI